MPAEIRPPTTPDEADALNQLLYGEDQALNAAPAEPDAQSRPWKMNLHASAGTRYDSNIFIASTGKKADLVSLLCAGGGISVGDYTARQNNYAIGDYTGTAELFGRHSDEDAYEQKASFEGQILAGHLTMHGDFQFLGLDDSNIDIGGRVRSQTYIGTGSARYDISDKTYLEATAQVTIADYDRYLGSDDERGGLSFNYLPDPSLTIGLGVMGGVLHVQDASAQTYEQYSAKVKFVATEKFTIEASAGVEDRQTAEDKGLITPILELAGDYKPFEGLDLTLTAYRRVMNSAYYAGSDYIATGVSAGAKYEISSRFALLLDTGYINCDYRDIAVGSNVSRDDNYFYVRPAFRYTASRYCNVELYYFYRNNESSVDWASFDDTQVGATLNLLY